MPIADGPAMYFGGTIMTFALPMGAFIVATVVLFYLFRARHSGPRLKYPTGAGFSSFGTREPGPVPAPRMPAPPAAPVEELSADPETPITLESTQPETTQEPGE
jgi:hypothetical protein